ncbi:unnamed protein product [Calypogeia fissa]
MCILCVASRWSRRIVTMLPWFIIPLIILWALSQLLPPGFRFEVTSPRLACVGVVLISLGWYELAMPRLSMWRAKRSAQQRERRRIEAQEAAKWRKEATRRCRNCLSPYRDQTPVGGKFMCTFCGHISKRPVLDVPGIGPEGSMSPGGPMPPPGSIHSQAPNGVGSAAAGSFIGMRPSRGGWAGRGWPDRGGGGWGTGGRGWTNSSKGWTPGGGGVGWGAGNGSWGSTNLSGKGWTNSGSAYWGGGTAPGGNWGGGSSYGTGGGGFFGSESCVAGDPHQGGLFYALFQSLSFIFFCLKWVCRKLWRRDMDGEDGSPSGGRRVGQKKGDDGGIPQGSRGEKARRKAEEKRQARLEREQLEAEERRQREEVARLVEERRRLRDEKLEADKESEREAAAERERELRREREAERRRLEKVKEKEKELAKEKTRETDSEDSKKKKEKKDVEKKTEHEKRVEPEKKGSPVQNGDLKKATKGPRGASVEIGHKAADSPVKGGIGAGGKVGSSKYMGLGKGSGVAPAKTGVTHQNNTSFWGKSLTSGKFAKGPMPASSMPGPVGNNAPDIPNGKPVDSSYSTWNRMPWTKGWGKSNTPSAEDNVAPPMGVPNVNGRADITKQNGAKLGMSGSSGSGVSDLSHSPAEVKQSTTAPSQARPWQRLFSNSHSSAVAPSPPPEIERHQERQQKFETVGAPKANENVSLESENTIFFGRGLEGSPVPKQSVVAPVGTPVHLPPRSFVPMSSPSLTSGRTASAFSPLLGSSTFPSLPTVPTPIGKPVQMPVHPPVSSPLHMPAPIQMPVPSQNQSNVPQDQLPQSLDHWGQPPVSRDDLPEVTEGDKWQMWDSPHLDQIQHSIAEPLNNWSYLNSGFLEQPKDTLRPLTQPLEPENQLPASLFSPHPLVGPGCTSGDTLGTLPVGNSQSLWSNHSAYESAMRIWDDSDSHQRVPPEFVDCITQEVMQDPVITADGHSYERAAIERWLKTHDTSPITGEVLPAPQEGYGSGVDKSLRPNHILRGQIIEYRENMARLVRGSMQESNRDNNWSAVGLGLCGSAWSTTERPQIGGFYATPGVQSVWSYNGSQN